VTRRLPRGAPGALALTAIALAGPWFAGSPDAPSIAPAAAQLLPPLSVVREVPLAGGGFARAPRLEATPEGVRVAAGAEWRGFPERAAGPVAARRLLLGTDQQGRDLLARTLHGARRSLLLALLAATLALALGTAVGVGRATAPRAASLALGGLIDGALGLPRLLLLLALAGALAKVPLGVALALGLAGWMETARTVEASARSLLARPFVAAASAAGGSRGWIAARHLLPGVLPVLAVLLPVAAAEAVLLEATLSFLGATGHADALSWGRIIAEGRALFPSGWWVAAFPGLLLALAALALGRLAQGAARDVRSAS
jgi:peptide/nickel transport system permease protein